MATGKKYGLILPSKKKSNLPAKTSKPSVFADDSSSDDEQQSRGKYGSSIWKENKRNAERMESHGSVVKAMAEDPSVFEYDSLYDKMQEDKRKADPRLKKKDSKPKYIAQLKKVAEKRKLEQEIIYERKVQRDIEMEGESENNEAYLTSAYRRKLEERKQMEEELKREEEIEAANDVTKQTDMTRFHKHLFNQIASGPSNSTDTDKEIKEKEPHRTSTHKPVDRTPSLEDKQRHVSESGHKDIGPTSPDSSLTDNNDLTESRRRHSSYDLEHRDSISKDREDIQTGQNEDQDKPLPTGVVSSDNSMSTESQSVTIKVDKEERRKVASVKRTNEEAQMSARERYLARKKAKLTKPIEKS